MKRESYSSFWQRIHTGARKNNFPLRVMFELTYNCNFKCKHCYVPPAYQKEYKQRELKTKEVFAILDQLKEAGCFFLGFTGGEPFLRKDIMDILKYAKRCGFEIIIYTNGSLITAKIADELSRINPNKVDMTIPAMSEEVFKRVTGVGRARDKVFKGIKLLHRKGIKLGFKTCVLKDNAHEIGGIRSFVKSLNSAHRLCDKLLPRLGTSEADERPGRRRPECGSGFSQAAITPAGELKTCLMIDSPKYNIMDVSLKGAWQMLRQHSACNECPFIINYAQNKN